MFVSLYCKVLESALKTSFHVEIVRASIDNGKYSLLFGSPEAWLKNDSWRMMLGNNIYRTRLCAVIIDEAHAIRQWLD